MKKDTIIEAINTLFTDFLQEQNSEHLIKAFQSNEFQDRLNGVISTEKKLKDPEAPKRPKSSYLFFCDDNRKSIKNENPGLKMSDISSMLGELWKNLENKKKEKYKKKAAQATVIYKKTMENYIRPSDNELSKLSINQKKKRKNKKKKDPKAPKRPTTAFFYFTREKRAEVKESNPEMKMTEVAKELGRMWKDDFADYDSRAEWVKMANEDKIRYENEKKMYKQDNVNFEVPEKKRGRKMVAVESDDSEDEDS